MPLNESNVPHFLGLSKRAARRGLEWDLLGISNVVLFPFLPQSLSGLQCVLGITRHALASGELQKLRIVFTDENKPSNHAWSDQNFGQVSLEPAAPQVSVDRTGFSIPTLPSSGGTTSLGMQMLASREDLNSLELFPITAPPLVMAQPGRVFVDIELNGIRYRRGEVICAIVPPAPMLESERRAIASRPGARNEVAMSLGCKKCQSSVAYFCQLDPTAPPSKKRLPQAISLHLAPSRWTCKCGETDIDLTFLKQGLHDLFRRPIPAAAQDSPISFSPLYERGRIQDILADYDQLIETATDEEQVQKYLEEHPILWAFLSPTKILHKPAVLTRKKADFGLLTAQRVLYLVEIEKPTTKLTNQDGSISADIRKGANQILDWQFVVADHRLALLSELGFSEADVQEIRYLLVGGLARRTVPTGLTKLRRTPFAPNTEFYCFDELASFLYSLSGELPRL